MAVLATDTAAAVRTSSQPTRPAMGQQALLVSPICR